MQDAASAPNQEHQHTQPATPEHMAAAPPQPMHEPVAAEHTAHSDYDSDPIKTARSGLATFWQNGRHALSATVAVQLLLAILTAVLAVIAILALIIAAITGLAGTNANYADLIMLNVVSQLPSEASQAISTLSAASGVTSAIALVAGLLALGLGTYMQASVLALGGLTVAERQSVQFGQVMKLALKRTGALFVLALICAVAVAAVFIVPLLFVSSSAASTPSSAFGAFGGLMLFYLVALVALIYVGIRLSFAPLAVVALSMGPIQAIKYTWHVSRKRWWEILGVASIVSILSTVVGIVFVLLHNSLTAAPGADLIVSLLEIVAFLVFNVLGMAILAERLYQYRMAGENQATHKVNYMLNIGMFVLAIAASSIAGGMENSLINKNTNPYGLPGNSIYQNDLNNSDSLQQELDQYYQDSQNMQNDDLYNPYTDPESPYYDPNYNAPIYDDGSNLQVN